MGQLTLPPAGVVYVDANAVIYHVEKIEPYFTASAPLWTALDVGQQQVATSALTLLEVLVKPLRNGDQALVAVYQDVLLATVGFDSIPIQRAVLEQAAALRANHSLKTPDAIHAASALLVGSSLFVTNDPAFRRVPGLNVAVLSEVVAQP